MPLLTKFLPSRLLIRTVPWLFILAITCILAMEYTLTTHTTSSGQAVTERYSDCIRRQLTPLESFNDAFDNVVIEAVVTNFSDSVRRKIDVMSREITHYVLPTLEKAFEACSPLRIFETINTITVTGGLDVQFLYLTFKYDLLVPPIISDLECFAATEHGTFAGSEASKNFNLLASLHNPNLMVNNTDAGRSRSYNLIGQKGIVCDNGTYFPRIGSLADCPSGMSLGYATLLVNLLTTRNFTVRPFERSFQPFQVCINAA